MGPGERRLRAALRALRPEQVRRQSAAWAREARLLDRAASRVRQVAETLVEDRLLGARTRQAAETALRRFASALDERHEALARTASLLEEAAEQMDSTQERYAALGDPPGAAPAGAVLGTGANAADLRERRADTLYRDLETGLARVERRLRALHDPGARQPVDASDHLGLVSSLPPDAGGPDHPLGGDGPPTPEAGGPGTPPTVAANPAPAGPDCPAPQAPGQVGSPDSAGSPWLGSTGTGVTPAIDGPSSADPVGAPAHVGAITVDAALPTGAVPQDRWRVEQVGAGESPAASPAAVAPIAAAGVAGAARSLAGVGAIPFRASSASGTRQGRRGRRGRRRLLRSRGGDRPYDPSGDPTHGGVLR